MMIAGDWVMLNKLLKLFSPFHTVEQTASIKPLVMQTFYGSGSIIAEQKPAPIEPQKSSVIPAKPVIAAPLIEPTLPTLSLLTSQARTLKNMPQYANANITIEKLTDDILLIGFTRHQKNLNNGIILYPTIVRFTHAWETIKTEAQRISAKIGYFRPTETIECLKIVNPADTDQTQYLVDYRFLKFEKSLLDFTNQSKQTPSVNKPSINR